jgi:hypothetical protein
MDHDEAGVGPGAGRLVQKTVCGFRPAGEGNLTGVLRMERGCGKSESGESWQGRSETPGLHRTSFGKRIHVSQKIAAGARKERNQSGFAHPRGASSPSEKGNRLFPEGRHAARSDFAGTGL